MDWSKTLIEEQELGFEDSTENLERKLSYVAAIREALELALSRDERVFVMGQGVDDPVGMFGITLDLHKKYGEDRVFDTPLSENALTGVATGAALTGMRPIYMHNRPDFLLLAIDQIVNHASKWSYMFGGRIHVPIVIWAAVGRGWGGAAQHTQTLQSLFMHVPGLRLVMPSRPYDAKGLLITSIAVTCPPKRSPVIMLVNWDKKGGQMVRKTYTPEQIINKLREAEIHINQGISIAEASRKISVTQQTYYRWRKEYGGLRIEQAKRLKSLEKENTRLKKLVADLSLDNAILKEASEGNY